MPAAVQLQLAPELDKKNGPRNDAIQLLARPKDIRGPGKTTGNLYAEKNVLRLISPAARDTAYGVLGLKGVLSSMEPLVLP